MNAGKAWSVVLQPTEAGISISRHLRAISDIMGHAEGMELVYNPRGETHITLPLDYDERKAQELANRINAIINRKGQQLIEAHLSFNSAAMRPYAIH